MIHSRFLLIAAVVFEGPTLLVRAECEGGCLAPSVQYLFKQAAAPKLGYGELCRDPAAMPRYYLVKKVATFQGSESVTDKPNHPGDSISDATGTISHLPGAYYHSQSLSYSATQTSTLSRETGLESHKFAGGGESADIIQDDRTEIRTTADGWRRVSDSYVSIGETHKDLATDSSTGTDRGRWSENSMTDTSWIVRQTNVPGETTGSKNAHDSRNNTSYITQIWTAPGRTVSCTGTHSRVEETPVLDGRMDYTEVNLSDEYTDEDLFNRVRSLMSTQPWAESYHTAATLWANDHSSLTMRKLLVRFFFATEAGRTYTLAWTENTLTSGGLFNSVPRSRTVTGTGSTQVVEVVVEPPATSGITFLSNIQVCPAVVTPAAAPRVATVGCCGGGGSVASETVVSLGGGPQLTVSLGQGGYGIPAGSVSMSVGAPSPLSASPVALVLSGASPAVEVVADASGTLAQVNAPQRLVDVETVGPQEFKLHVFASANLVRAGARFVTNGLTELATFRVVAPSAAPGNLNTVEIHEDRGGALKLNVFEFDPSVGGWTWLPPGGLSAERVRALWDADQHWLTQVREWINRADGSIARHEDSLFEKTGSDDSVRVLLREHRLGSGSSALVSRFDYSSDRNRIIARQDPYGAWIRLAYDNQGRITKETSSFRNSAFDGPVNEDENSWVRERTFVFETVDAANDDGVGLPGLAREQTDLLGGVAIAQVRRVVHRDPARKTVEWIREYRIKSPGAALSDPGNLLTETRFFVEGPFRGLTRSVRHADGTLQLNDYRDSNGRRTLIVDSGQPNADSSAILQGTHSESVVNGSGQTLSSFTRDIARALVTSSLAYDNFDSRGRPQRRLDVLTGLAEWSVYGCCQLESTINREGTVTTYAYDALGRVTQTSTAGITTLNTYDATGNLTKVQRQGTSGPPRTLTTYGYDAAGRMIWERGPLGTLTTFSEDLSGGRLIRTTTEASGTSDAVTRAEKYFPDGQLAETGGTAGNPTRYEYGLLQEGSNYWPYQLTVRLSAEGTTTGTNEWAMNVTDSFGRGMKTVYADSTPASLGDNPYSLTEYDALGRLTRQTDPDGVVTLHQQPSLSERVSAVDLNRNGVIDLAGPDRVTRTVIEVASEFNTVTRRTTVSEYRLAGSATPVVTRVHSLSVDGLHSWLVTPGVANPTEAHTGLGAAGYRYVTNMAPDGSFTVNVSQNGRLLSTTRRGSDQTPVFRETYAYDALGRRTGITDARNGTTQLAYDDADQVTSVTTPAPGTGQAPQTTVTVYDSLGRAREVHQPDGTSVFNEYFPTGSLKRTWGSRTYAADYTYDSQGRMKTLKTWQDRATQSGAAVTTWNYNPYRGWLDNKRYADGKGPDFTYTKGGKMKIRFWARTGTGGRIKTVWTYGFEKSNGPEDVVIRNDSGDLVSLSYENDPAATPATGFEYDRCGHATRVSRNGLTTVRSFNTAGDLLTESNTGGALDGLNLTLTYDPAGRRETLVARNGVTVLNSITQTHDTASRLQKVDDGTYSATYSYLANSSLPGTITFRQGSSVRMTTKREFDYLGRLLQVGSVPAGTGQRALSYRYSYNDVNQRYRQELPEGTAWLYEYDGLGQLTSSKRFWADGTPVAGQQFEYAYDDIGNRKWVLSGGDDKGGGLRKSTYTLKSNGLNQYDTRTMPAALDIIGAALPSSAVTVNSMAAGARKDEYFWKAVSLPPPTTPQWQRIDVAAGASGPQSGYALLPPATCRYTYDDDGNLLSDGIQSYVWDAENRLLECIPIASSTAVPRQKVTFAYDDQSRRILKTPWTWNVSSSTWTAGTPQRYLYEGWNLVAEIGSSPAQSYLWGLDFEGAGGIGALVASRAAGSAGTFAVLDGQGSVTASVSGDTGMLSQVSEDDAYGGPLRRTGGWTSARFGYSTKLRDHDQDLLYFGYRHLGTRDGRWGSRDPNAEFGGSALYGYVSNNPVTHHDVLGLYQADFHFYTIYYIFRALCFTHEEAQSAASASQQVDEDSATEPIVTSSANRAFWHFRGSTPIKATERNPPDLMDQIIASGVIARANPSPEAMGAIGTLLHTYADSWSHEGFTAWHNDAINRRTGSGRPNIGHADAPQGGEAPDLPYNNVTKAEEAARIIRLVVGSRCDNCDDSDSQAAFISDVRRGFSYISTQTSGIRGIGARNAYWRIIIRNRFGVIVDYPFSLGVW